MRIVGRIIGWLLVLAALASLAYDLGRVARGETFWLSPLGKVWFAIDPGSLNLTQAVIERYIWEPLWDPVILWILQQPAALVFLLPGVILVLACRGPRRPRRKRWFH